MAKIHLTDLEESVELDRDAMQEIIGGLVGNSNTVRRLAIKTLEGDCHCLI